MRESWKRFLSRIWGSAEGWVFVAYKGGGQFQHKAYTYPEQFDLLLNELSRLNKWACVYFCPHLFVSGSGRVKEQAAPVSALWIDKDEGDVSEITPKPTICWKTSENRHQAVWLLKEPVDPKRAETACKYLTYRGKGDKGGWHLAKVIRVPQSTNHKYKPPFVGIVLWDDGPIYSIEELEPVPIDHTAEEFIRGLEAADTPPFPRRLPEVKDVLLSFGRVIPRAAWGILEEHPQEDTSWSEKLWRLERLLSEAGLPPEAVFVIAKHSPWNKYARDGRPDMHLWAEVCKAVDARGTPVPKEKASLPWNTLDKLLIHSERPSWLIENCWTLANVGWIAGIGKSYKSTISLDLALSVASGKPFLGAYPVVAPGPVLMVQEEDPIWRVAHRIQIMSEAKGITHTTLTEDGRGMTLAISKKDTVPLYVSTGGRFSFADQSKVEALEAAIDQYRPRLVVMDPFFMLVPGIDEYKAGELTEALNTMKHWRDLYGCAIAVVHHYRKGGATENSQKLYGSMALYAWSESSFFVSRREGDRNRVWIERDIKDAERSDPIGLEVIDLDEEYSIVVGEAPEDRIEGIGTRAGNRVLSFLKSVGPGGIVTRAEILAATRLDSKTVKSYLDKLEEEEMIRTEKGGKGGRLQVHVLSTLFETGDNLEVIL